MLVGETISSSRRTGVQRVVLETAKSLAGLADFNLVRWDVLEGRLRFLDADELDRVFGAGDWPAGLKARFEARRVGRPFYEQLEHPRGTWILAPEVAWHEPDGVDMLARAMAHCRTWGGRFAAIFYDLIPIRNAAYAEFAEAHEAYLAELVKADLIIPISRHAGADLEALWRERGISPQPRLRPVLLPVGGFGSRPASAPKRELRKIAMFGTVEPRKRQVEFLKVMENARLSHAELADWEVVVVGSLHPSVAAEFNALVRRNDWLTYRDFLDDGALNAIISEASFTVFASEDEGYGLPISESLAAGVPCLCANFGSMAEIADGGGCLTVDVRSADALETALVELCTRPATLARLRDEIGTRRLDSWADYAQRVACAMSQAETKADRTAVILQDAPPSAGQAPMTTGIFEQLARADIARFDSPQDIERFIAEAAERKWPALLPPALVGDAAREAADVLGRQRSRRRSIADTERAFAKARQYIQPGSNTRPIFLRVLISTYNRADFVVANVRWILNKILGLADVPVELVVVDGGSTDGTVERLYQIYDNRFRIIECPTNVGMLAGLREAARAPGAEYIWLIGDDDFLDPKGFRDMLGSLKKNAGAPFAFTNFSVYHRAALAPTDTVSRLILEGRPVAEAVAASDVLSVRQVAEQTDNLFTAIYTIVWRADLLSAAYEHAFDGAPFDDLTESIPCTEFILRDYADCDCVWRASSTTIVGNAHNSWSRQRPRWHAVIMPLALALAREAGVDAARLQSWADTHLGLLDEALAIADHQGWTVELGDKYAELARRVFRVRPAKFSAQ
jgi:glycosyltransferase involved in cell wall biosynthesis